MAAASNVALSRSAPTLPNTGATRATIRGAVSARAKIPLSLPSSSLFYTGSKPLVALRSSVNRCSAPAGPAPIRATICSGDRLPDATLSYVDTDGEQRRTTTVAELTAGKKVVFLALDNAVQVDQMYLAHTFHRDAEELRKSMGLDTVACVGRMRVKEDKENEGKAMQLAWLVFQRFMGFLGMNESAVLREARAALAAKEGRDLELKRVESSVVLLADSGEFVEALGTPTHCPLWVFVEDGVVKTSKEFHEGRNGGEVDGLQALINKLKYKELREEMIDYRERGASSPQHAHKKKGKEFHREGGGEVDDVQALINDLKYKEFNGKGVGKVDADQVSINKLKFEELRDEIIDSHAATSPQPAHKKKGKEFHGKDGGKVDEVRALINDLKYKEFHEVRDEVNAVREFLQRLNVKDVRKIIRKRAPKSPQSAHKKESTSEGINGNEFIDGSSGKRYVEELMKQQVKQEKQQKKQDDINKLYELKGKHEKLYHEEKLEVERTEKELRDILFGRETLKLDDEEKLKLERTLKELIDAS